MIVSHSLGSFGFPGIFVEIDSNRVQTHPSVTRIIAMTATEMTVAKLTHREIFVLEAAVNQGVIEQSQADPLIDATVVLPIRSRPTGETL